MSKVIAVVNQKGGTGKTTTAVNLGAALAEAGKFVLLVDLDPQGNASSGAGARLGEGEAGMYEVLMGRALASDVKRKTAITGMDVLPSSQNLSGANVELVSYERREFQLHLALGEIRGGYDYVLIDCPPSLGLLTINGLVAADEVIIPVQCEYYALEGLGQLLTTVNLVKKSLRPNLTIMGVLLTMYHRRIRLSEEVVAEVKNNYGGRVFRTMIPRNVELAEAPSFGQSILVHAPRSKGAKSYRALAREVASF